MLRKLSVSLRYLQSRKSVWRTLSAFDDWAKEIALMPTNQSRSKKILIIRLDEIGDYLLFRNTLAAYRQSPKWVEYEFTLLGNILWKSFFDFADIDTVHNAIWMDKNRYYNDEAFRKQLWRQLRNEGFEIVICPSHSRPLMLDDICMLASGAEHRIGIVNDLEFDEMNQVSDRLYTALYKNDMLQHEFFFNRDFTNWCCDTALNYTRPSIPRPGVANTPPEDYILFFIGASKQSKLWPAKRWIELVTICKKENNPEVILSGGKADLDMANQIMEATGCKSIAGATGLVDMIDWIANAKAIVTNDTMACHLSASCGTPAVIIANGVNFYKFTAYYEAGISNIRSVYPGSFLRKWARHNHKMFKAHLAVTRDIGTIEANVVYNELIKLLSR